MWRWVRDFSSRRQCIVSLKQIICQQVDRAAATYCRESGAASAEKDEIRKIITTHPGKIALLKKKQVLEWLPISERSLYRYIHAGKLPCYKLDGLLLFNPDDIETFLKRRHVGGPEAAFRDGPIN